MSCCDRSLSLSSRFWSIRIGWLLVDGISLRFGFRFGCFLSLLFFSWAKLVITFNLSFFLSKLILNGFFSFFFPYWVHLLNLSFACSLSCCDRSLSLSICNSKLRFSSFLSCLFLSPRLFSWRQVTIIFNTLLFFSQLSSYSIVCFLFNLHLFIQVFLLRYSIFCYCFVTICSTSVRSQCFLNSLQFCFIICFGFWC